MKPHDAPKLTVLVTAFLFAFPSLSFAQGPHTAIITNSGQSDALKFAKNVEIRNAPPGSDTAGFGVAAALKPGSGAGVTGSTHNFTIFTAPNNPSSGWSVDVRSINLTGNVTGYLSSFAVTRGFVSDRNGRMTVFDAPNSSSTVSISINGGGDVTGYFSDASLKTHSFVRGRDGTITVFDVPNLLNTSSSGINDGGDVTGVAADGLGVGHGFIRYSDGRIIVFDPPHSSYTGAMSINANRDVTGFFLDENPAIGAHGFVRYSDGSIIVFDPAGSVSTSARSINRDGDVTGYFQYGSLIRGFVRYRNGTILIFDSPNSSTTFAYGINDNGDATGSFIDPNLLPNSPFGGKVRGFLRDRSGVITVFDAPNAIYTSSFSINKSGDVTGFFWDPDKGQLGYARRD